MSNTNRLFTENNVVSLRTAVVTVVGNFVIFILHPADRAAKWPKGRTWLRPQDFNWMDEDRVLLYRLATPTVDELPPNMRFLFVEPMVRLMSFEKPPRFELLWVDSGQSVALHMNGEPWAFIDEASHCGFSKGMLKEGKHMRVWDQQLFEKIFF